MASIRKHSNGRWQARYKDQTGKYHAKNFPRKVDAQRWVDAASASVVRGDHVAPQAGRVTIAEYAETWLAARVHLKPKTVAGYRSLMYTRVVPYWGDVALNQVTYEAVTVWVAEMVAEGLSASRTRQSYHLLTGMLGEAVKGKRIPANPAADVELPRMVSRRGQHLTHSQLDDLADAAGNYRALILTLGYCGIRWGEAAALQVAQVNLLRGRIQVVASASEVNGVYMLGEPKAHQHRSVPVPTFLRQELAVAMAGKTPKDFVFTSPQGAPLRSGNFRRNVFDRATRQVGLEGFTPHDLRHTAASLAIAAGASVKAVQRMLGHGSATLTLDRYGHLFTDELDAVAEQLNSHRADVHRTKIGQTPVAHLPAVGH